MNRERPLILAVDDEPATLGAPAEAPETSGL